MIEQESECLYCAALYEINFRLNDGFCDDCREYLNAQAFIDWEEPEAEEASDRIGNLGKINPPIRVG